MSIFLDAQDLNAIKGLIHYLDKSFDTEHLDVEVMVQDTNTNQLGMIKRTNDFYAFHYGSGSTQYSGPG